MTEANATPFAGLDPDRILAAIERLGFVCDGRVLALNSYENRVYRIGIENHAPLVVKFYRPGRWSDEAILEEHRFSNELRAADLSVITALEVAGRSLHHDQQFRFALFPMQGGHAPEPGDRDTLQQIGRTLARLHTVGAANTFVHRTTLTIASHAIEPVHYLLEAGWLSSSLEEKFVTICDSLIDEIEDAWARAGDIATLRLHGDCHPGNILWRKGTAHFVDLDDALTGPAMQDLWMLVSGERDEQRTQFSWLLEGYEIFREFDYRQLHLIEALRAMRLLSYHAWVARRWHDPAFPAAFPWFESPRHWEEVITQLQEQVVALQKPPLTLF